MVQTASRRIPGCAVAGESRCGRLIPWFWVRVPDGPSQVQPFRAVDAGDLLDAAVDALDDEGGVQREPAGAVEQHAVTPLARRGRRSVDDRGAECARGQIELREPPSLDLLQ